MLIPYKNKLDKAAALHLIRRLNISVNLDTLKKIEGKTASEAISFFLDNSAKKVTSSPPSWVNEGHQSWWNLPKESQQKEIDLFYNKLYKQFYEFKYWWQEEMRKDTDSFSEKMTLFWHSHFTTRYDSDEAQAAQLLYRQINMFRKNAFGNLRTLLENICTDGAMLIFLNGKESNKEAPNENFSRELLELYSTGLGHYTETDVKEGARVFTGWNVNIFQNENVAAGIFTPYLEKEKHDFGEKKYLGQSIKPPANATQQQVLDTEIKKLIDIILTQKKEAVAKHLSQKIYRFFIYSNPNEVDQQVVNDMANILIANNWEIKPMIKALFESEHFYSENIRGSQIKNPVETIIGITRHFDVKADWKDWVMKTMGMEITNPPNVAGWDGYRKWVDSRTFPYAIQQMTYFIWNQTNDDLVKWIKKIEKYDDPKLFIEQVLHMFFVKLPTATQTEKYMKIVLNGSPDYEWSSILANTETAGFRIKVLMIELIKSPAFHLN
jgi:uncharacterized protein (DUF1800 family)